MRLPITTLAVFIALLGSLGVDRAGARERSSPNACTVLKAALHSAFSRAVTQPLHFYPTVAARGQVFNCRAARGPLVDPWEARSYTFGFLPPAAWGSAAAAHRFWQRQWNASKGKPGVERLRGFGADEAFGIERSYTDPKPHINTDITWVKGAYEGGIELWGPGRAGDLEDGQDLLKALMKRIPKS